MASLNKPDVAVRIDAIRRSFAERPVPGYPRPQRHPSDIVSAPRLSHGIAYSAASSGLRERPRDARPNRLPHGEGVTTPCGGTSLPTSAVHLTSERIARLAAPSAAIAVASRSTPTHHIGVREASRAAEG